jgi:ParB/RepB/Spo0J family partition protein
VANQPEDKKKLNRLPGSGIRRDLRDAFGTISQNSQPTTERNNTEARIVQIDRLSPNKDNPRQNYNTERDEELARDIAVRGILEPLIVRQIGEDEQGTLYQIVAGERRYRAARIAELSEVPVIIKAYTDQQAKFTSLVENLQRQDLDQEDEARYFNLLIEQFNLSYKQIADYINRSPSYVASRMKLLNASFKEDIEVEEANATRETDSDGIHKHPDSARKLKKSQSEELVAKSFIRFQTNLTKLRLKVPEMDKQNRQRLVEQIREVRQQLEDLEEEIS